MENGFPVLPISAFFCKSSGRLKPTIVGHCLLAYIYSAIVNIVDRLSVSYEKNCYVLS